MFLPLHSPNERSDWDWEMGIRDWEMGDGDLELEMLVVIL